MVEIKNLSFIKQQIIRWIYWELERQGLQPLSLGVIDAFVQYFHVLSPVWNYSFWTSVVRLAFSIHLGFNKGKSICWWFSVHVTLQSIRHTTQMDTFGSHTPNRNSGADKLAWTVHAVKDLVSLRLEQFGWRVKKQLIMFLLVFEGLRLCMLHACSSRGRTTHTNRLPVWV